MRSPVPPTHTAARFVLLCVVLGCNSDPIDPSDPPPTGLAADISLPAGFKIEEFATGIIRPRSLALGSDGTVYVGTYFFTKGVTSPVYALRDLDGDYRVDRVWSLRNAMGTPNGVDYHGGDLFIVDEHRVLRVPDILH